MEIKLLRSFDHQHNGVVTELQVEVRYCMEYRVVTRVDKVYAIMNGLMIEISGVLHTWFPEFVKIIEQHDCWDELAGHYEEEID